MARKKIALFMSEITQVFQTECGKAIIDMASLHDMDVVVFASYGSYTSPYGRNLLSEIGKKSILQLPDYSSFEAIIALPGSFDINGMDREFYELVKTNASCPVILLQTGHPDFYTISAENRETMYKMTRHFIEVHQFTDICYMSGPYMHKDSPDRLRGFVNAMRDSGLSIEANTIFEGNYWRNRGAKALDFFMQGRRSYPQAIICANDYMALSICEELKKRGVRVPEDVCVCGFDGIKEGEDTTPSLTTVTIRPEKFAEAAFQLIDDIKAGKQPDKQITISDEINFRASCGCGKQIISRDIDQIYKAVADEEFLLREAGRITADYQNTLDIDSALSVATYYFHTLNCETGFICYCDENDPDFSSDEPKKPFTEYMILLQIMDEADRRHAHAANLTFKRRNLLPLECFDTDDPGVYIVFPLFFKNKAYGYLVLKPNEKQWPNSLTYTYTSTLSTAIENCYYQKKFSALSEITKLSQTDELTGLNNRRGFENALQEILTSSPEDAVISIASIDMDNLKNINDIHGHAEGDYALSEIAKVLTKCLKENEFCARFGGDEFSAVLISDTKGRGEEFSSQVISMLEDISSSSGKPFNLHASIGISDLKGRDTNHIVTCMQEADEIMYAHKRAYKSNRP